MNWFANIRRSPPRVCRSLRCLLIVHFTSATLLPLLLFALLSYFLVTENMKDRITEDNRLTALTIRREIDSILQNTQRTARWISRLMVKGDLEGDRFAEFFEDSLYYLPYFEKLVAADENGDIVGVVPHVEQLLGTSVRGRRYFGEVTSSHSRYWSDTFFSSISHSTSVVCAVPYDDGVLAAHANLDWLGTIANEIVTEGKRTILMTDRNGAVITYRDRELVERKRNFANLAPVRGALDGEEGTYDFTFQDTRYLCYALRIETTGWPLLVMRPYANTFSLQRKAGLLLLAVMGISLALGVALSYLTGGRIMTPLNRLARSAREIAGGNYRVYPSADLHDIRAVESALSEMSRQVEEREEELRASIYEKELLVMEIHHRVKNNLQLIISLLNLKQSSSREQVADEALNDTINHIYSIAQVHEQLYHHRDVSRIDFHLYADNLISHILHSTAGAERTIRFRNLVDETLQLSIDTAIPCGLILSELVANACTHAFEQGEEGAVTLEGYRNGNEVRIILSDNGRGFPKASFTAQEGLGFQIVHVLAEQLEGSIAYERKNGSHFSITFTG